MADKVLVLQRGRISLGLRIDLSRSRAVGDGTFEQLRNRFLAEFGVPDPTRRQPVPNLDNGGPIGSLNAEWASKARGSTPPAPWTRCSESGVVDQLLGGQDGVSLSGSRSAAKPIGRSG
jgi:hypothetical protein